ncbi:MAG: O-antigen ligase family protein, partial [Bacteroidales bacterium]|nr:O-antigen ligase family protein [Bacteroidales bacterium]
VNNNGLLENGNFVNMNICRKELDSAWNKVSKIGLDDFDNRGQYIYPTLLRYMTSLGLEKDARGVSRLTLQDIKNIENGETNYRYANKSSLAERIYVTIWELDVYFKFNECNDHSVSQRIEYQRTGLLLAKNNFFTGVGTGDVNDEYQQWYEENNSNLSENNRHRAHNQFLTIMIAFGIFGFIAFVFAWFFPVYSGRKELSFTFIAFFVIATASMFSDDTMETSTGAVFVAYFYSLLRWVKLQKTERNTDNDRFMRMAIDLSLESIDNGGGPFGSVIVKNGEVISKASNSVTKDHDPTAHAEVNAIRQAGKKLGTFDLSGCEIYASCEPCPMCLAAIYWAKIDKLYYACTKKDADKIGFSDNFIYEEFKRPEVKRKVETTQILHDDAIKAFEKWESKSDKVEY